MLRQDDVPGAVIIVRARIGIETLVARPNVGRELGVQDVAEPFDIVADQLGHAGNPFSAVMPFEQRLHVYGPPP